jgi:hypothetical protein
VTGGNSSPPATWCGWPSGRCDPGQPDLIGRRDGLFLQARQADAGSQRIRGHHDAGVVACLGCGKVGLGGPDGRRHRSVRFPRKQNGGVGPDHAEDDLLFGSGTAEFRRITAELRLLESQDGSASKEERNGAAQVGSPIRDRVGVVQLVHGEVGGGEPALVQQGAEGVHGVVALDDAFGEVHPGEKAGACLLDAGRGRRGVIFRDAEGRVLLKGGLHSLRQSQPFR